MVIEVQLCNCCGYSLDRCLCTLYQLAEWERKNPGKMSLSFLKFDTEETQRRWEQLF